MELHPDMVKSIQEVLRNPPTVKLLSFRDIEQRTGVLQRHIRYIRDHNLLGRDAFLESDNLEPGRGIARGLSMFSGFIASLAAMMMESGLRSGIVRKTFDHLLRWAASGIHCKQGRGIQAFMVFTWAGSICVEVGDGKNIRILVTDHRNTESRLPCPTEMPWENIETGHCLADGYVPLVVIRLNLAELKKKLE